VCSRQANISSSSGSSSSCSRRNSSWNNSTAAAEHDSAKSVLYHSACEGSRRQQSLGLSDGCSSAMYTLQTHLHAGLSAIAQHQHKAKATAATTLLFGGSSAQGSWASSSSFSTYALLVTLVTSPSCCLQDTKIRVVLEGPPAPPSPVPEVNEADEDNASMRTAGGAAPATDGFSSAAALGGAAGSMGGAGGMFDAVEGCCCKARHMA
jgi:hypothetical protein